MNTWRVLVLFGLLWAVGPVFEAKAGDLPDRFDFCAEGGAKRWIRVVIDGQTKDLWNVVLTTNGRNEPARTSSYIFGSTAPRAGFLVAILPMAKTPPLLIFDDGHAEWAGHYYVRCP